MLKIQIAKRPDGSGVLSCTRADGSITWQKQKATTAAHFALHDLTHYAVETTLRLDRGFFGLIVQGWEVEDTTGKGARGPLPQEALAVETIVGLFDRERSSNLIWTAEEFNTYSPLTLTGQQIAAIRHRRADLFRRWSALPIGSKLELEFPLDPHAAS